METVMTAAIAERVKEERPFSQFIMISLHKFMTDDWGDICEEDRKQNDAGLAAYKKGDMDHADRTMGVYPIPADLVRDEEKIWIIREWDHSVTTILYPSEY